ncbi:hypothetical protein PPACK8108_LOCUS457 [Phakopsora pachyrhizi]|uniref:Uncharacterized protein n=1 Tax=Phakopsora pachyrhizi TaxID=170000 RepID=A0AAV0AEW3_PHAPC|nr:hypothetical protein PPACK8108_LOCUS457 [Phakopsora pachyrhizi]
MRSMTREMNCDCRAVLMCRRSALVPDNNGGYCTFEVKKGVPNIRPPPLCRSRLCLDIRSKTSPEMKGKPSVPMCDALNVLSQPPEPLLISQRIFGLNQPDKDLSVNALLFKRDKVISESNGDRQWELEKDEIRDKCLVEDWKVGQADGRGGRLELVSPMEGTFCGCKRITAQTAL